VTDLPRDDEGVRTLRVVRAAVFGVWCVTVVATDLRALADYPAVLIDPAGPFGWLPDAWIAACFRAPVLLGLRVATGVLCALAAAGLRPLRPLGLAAAAAATVYALVVESSGHACHLQVQLVLVMWAIAVAQPRQPAADTALTTAAAVLLLGYACSAAYRVAHHPLAIVAGDALYWLAVKRSVAEGSGALAELLLAHRWTAAPLQLALAVATGLELAAPLALGSPRFRRVWVPFALLFHAVNAVFLHIVFWQQAVLVVVLLTPTVSFVRRRRAP